MNSIRFALAVLVAQFLFIPVSELAWAGIGAHGGNVVRCVNQSTVTLDFYNASLPTGSGPANLVDLSALTFAQTVELIEQRLEGSALKYLYLETKVALGPVSTWLQTSLEEVDDSDEPYILPSGCSRLTAAVRQNGTIYLDPSVYSLLSPSQQGLLYVHEILYAASMLDSSASVRDFFRIYLKDKPTSEEMAQVSRKLGPFYMFEFLKYNSESRSAVFDPTSTTLKPDVAIVDVRKMAIYVDIGTRIYNWYSCSSNGRICEYTFPDGGTYSIHISDPDHFVIKMGSGSESFERRMHP